MVEVPLRTPQVGQFFVAWDGLLLYEETSAERAHQRKPQTREDAQECLRFM